MLNKSPSSKRKTLTATPLLTLLVSVLAGSLFANTAAANPIGYWFPWDSPPAPIVQVVELNTDKLTLTFSAVKNGPWITPYGMGADYEHGPYCDWGNYDISSFRVLVDGKQWIRQDWCGTSNKVSLEGLSNGWHIVEVSATATGMYQSKGYVSRGSSGVIEFQVDTPPPSVRVITSQKTFEASSSTADVPVNFTVNEPVSWVGYSLDGNNLVTAIDEVALTERFGAVNYQLVLNDVPAGAHSLTVYAEDAGGNRGESETFSFTVTQETPSEGEQASTPFPTAFAAVGILTAVVAVGSGLIFYFKKRKRQDFCV